MKKCPNNHDNPNNAKYCRICGYNFDNSFCGQFTNYWNTIVNFIIRVFNTIVNESRVYFTSIRYSTGFTPDMFPNISLAPCSVAKVDFKCKKGGVFMIILVIMFILFTSLSEQIGSLLLSTGMPIDYSYVVAPGVAFILFLIFLFKFFPFMQRVWKWFKYKMNADYIEQWAFMSYLYRIARKGKLGLFDKSKNDVTLRSQYDNLTKFDAEHILVEKKGKKGLFSTKKMRIIVPIRFERIEPFNNSIVKCHKGVEQFYYDVNGNKMK